MSAPPLSIASLHAQWRAGNGTPLTFVEECLSTAAARNDQSHAYTQLLRQRAISAAQHATVMSAGIAAWPALFGVPVAIKDNIDIAGYSTSVGSRLLAQAAALRSASLVERLEAAGAIAIGKTNMDEAALGASGRNPFFGRCVNPRWPAYLAGGSSSGSAAAVADGSCLLAIGTDTLGSVRIPAALCGVSGFKPSWGLLPVDGVTPLHAPFDAVGLFANSLDDIEAAFEVLCDAPMVGDETRRDGVRVAILDSAALAATDPGIATAYLELIAQLRHNADIDLVPFPALAFGAAARAGFREVARALAERLPPPVPGDSQAGAELRELLLWARALPPDRLAAGRELLRATGSRFAQALRDCDALLTPACPVAAIEVSAPVPANIAEFVALANVTGSPAVCWPVTIAGQVFSLQLTAARGRDRQLLRAARQLQALSGKS